MLSEARSYPAIKPFEMLAFPTSTMKAIVNATTPLTTAVPDKIHLVECVRAH